MAQAITVFVIGVEHAQGLSKKDNKPYNFSSVHYLVPRRGWSNEKGASQVLGKEVETISMNPTPELFEQFKNIESHMPCLVELYLEVNPERMQRNWVIDMKPVKQA